MRPLILTFAFLAGPGNALAAAPDVDDPRVAPTMALYAKRASLENHEKAARLFADIAASHPENLEAQIWCARTAYYCAHRYREQRDDMTRIARWSNDCGVRLRRRFAGNYQADLWTILSRFKLVAADSFIPPLGEIESLTRQLEAIAGSAPNEYGAYILLGAIYRELPGWPLSIGDEEKSLNYLLRAAKLTPNNAEMLLELAASYNALDQPEKARTTYEQCIQKGDGHPDLTWETADARAWAKKMLAELD